MSRSIRKFTHDEITDLIGEFTWNFGSLFFIETEFGNLIFDSPEYGGSGELRVTDDSLELFLGPDNYGRDKGKHRIGDYLETFKWEHEDFTWVTQEMFDDELEKVVEEKAREGTLMATPGLYEVVSEEFNNEVLERLQEKR